MSDETLQDVAKNIAIPSSRIIVQQCLSAKVQVRPAEGTADAEFVQINRGVVIYVCFLQSATSETVNKMVKTVLNVRLSQSEGEGRLVSVLELPGDVLIVPQATLGGRVKGRSMQYHGNVDKQTGLQLYEQFVTHCRGAVQQITEPRTVHCGTYGNRQVLSVVTNGPYTHVIDI